MICPSDMPDGQQWHTMIFHVTCYPLARTQHGQSGKEVTSA